MSKTLHAFDYLSHVADHPPRPVCVAYGDEPFLKTEVLQTLRQSVLGNDDGAFSLKSFNGTELIRRERFALREVLDELSTVSMFGGPNRLVIVEEADPFVSEFRAPLEDYLARPKHHGVLLLEVKTWASNTRLFKAVAEHGLQIECKAPAPALVRKWLIGRSQHQHGAKLEAAAAELLLDLVDPELGLLDQEVARLALLAGPGGSITPQLVQANVGNWRTRSTWDMIDTATDGDARSALAQLDRLLVAGEDPIAILAQVASPLRRLAAANQLVARHERAGRRVSLRAVLEQAGCKKFTLEKDEQRMRQIGRDRGQKLHRWLLDADLALKGASSSSGPARLVLEQLIVKLSKSADPRKRLELRP